MSEDLYNKHRPTKFKDVVGQDDACELLQGMVKSDRVPQAMLIKGPSGCGKTTLARILARRLKCGPLDLHEQNAAEVRGIDEVRRLGAMAYLNPASGPVRFFIIDEAQGLTKDAQAAILKILEDPKPGVHFVLCSTDPEKLLPTIRTRCTEIGLAKVQDGPMTELVRKVCKAEGGKLEEEVEERLIEAADGSPRKALVVLQSVLEVEGVKRRLAVILKNDDKRQAIELCRLMIDTRSQWSDAVKILKDVQGEPESLRRMVLGYATTVLLSAKPNPRAFLVIAAFENNFFDSGRAGLVAACFDVLRPTKGR